MDLLNKYQSLILKFANTDFGKDYFLISRDKDVVKVFKNGFTETDGYSSRSHFTSRFRMLNKLRIPLTMLDIAVGFDERFKRDVYALLHYMGLKDQWAKYPLVALTVSTFTSDTDPETSSVDGIIGRDGVSEIWSTLRSGAGTYVSSAGADPNMAFAIDAAATTDEYSGMYRSAHLFDTAALPDGDTIDSATLDFIGHSKAEGNGPTGIGLVASTPDSNTTLIKPDFSQFDTVRQATDISFSGYNATGSNTFTLNSTGISNIDNTGVTKFGARAVFDIDNVEPDWKVSGTRSSCLGWCADKAGEDDPLLSVTHSSGAMKDIIGTGVVPFVR